jgi:ribosomal protein S13
LFYTNKTFYETFQATPGLGRSFKSNILDKLELKSSINVNITTVYSFKKRYNRELIGFLNHYYSQVSSVNNSLLDLSRLNIIRLYLIRCYKGRCHALGKPVNGQRTWSNAWSVYKNNLVLRRFISETKNSLAKLSTPEKINYKLIKKNILLNRRRLKK